MKDGFIKVAAATPKIKLADCKFNAGQIIKIIKQMYEKKVKVLALPELCLTGYTCYDLFFQKQLVNKAKEELLNILKATKNIKMLTCIGLPVEYKNKLYNCEAIIFAGEILGFVPKSFLPNYNEFYEERYFEAFSGENTKIKFNGQDYLFGTNILFACENMPELKIGVEICEDIWASFPKSASHASASATLILNASASNELVGKANSRKNLISSHSLKYCCGYVYACAGQGESTTDMVFAGHNMIFENGKMLSQSEPFKNKAVISEIDLQMILARRQKINTFCTLNTEKYDEVKFTLDFEETNLTRKINNLPFVLDQERELETVLNIQAYALKQRLENININKIILGLSGGVDSTLVLMVACRTFDLMNIDRKNIITITMPCFGTSSRTKNNALNLAKELHLTIKEVDITKSVLQHFKDINQNENEHDTTFENAQARIRTLILMDFANKENAIVLGTGDMSELALGFATYGGDHLSMYNVNCSVTKTLAKQLLLYLADASDNKNIKKTLKDIVKTPISPELLPTKDGKTSQITEDIVGPYELNDFFLYYFLKYGFTPRKIFRLAYFAFGNKFSKDEIFMWLDKFYTRFFAAQFKRSCSPDGPKVTSISLSPRGDFKMVSDASVNSWKEDLINLKGEMGLV